MATLGCGLHTAFIYERGGLKMVGEFTDVAKVVWERVRDDISQASVVVEATSECCSWLSNINCGAAELHIYRRIGGNLPAVKVWSGVVTRLEYGINTIEVHAYDFLWVPKNTALTVGYNKAYPNISTCGEVMQWLMKDMTFAKYGDPWQCNAGVHWLKVNGEPKTSKAIKAFSITTWEDFDKFADDSGMDYTMMNRQLYFWDTHYVAKRLPTLLEEYLLGEPKIIEYGNEFATAVYVTNGNGTAGVATADAAIIAKYGHVDFVVSSWNEGAAADAPAPEDIAEWTTQAKQRLNNLLPPTVSILVGDNNGLSPDAPYDINDLMPGAWLTVMLTRSCRVVQEDHKLNLVHVEETPSDGEVVSITTIGAPMTKVEQATYPPTPALP